MLTTKHLWDGQMKSTHLHNHASLISLVRPTSFQLPEIRFLTPDEDQQFTDLAEEIAEKCSGVVDAGAFHESFE
jgi:hypothetical protein